MSVMRRAVWVWLICALCGCGRKAPPRELLPAEAGGWRRVSLRDAPPAEAPELVPRAGLKRIQDAVYDGPGKIEARVYELASPAAGLDLAQRWKPAPDTVFFYQENYF